MSVDSADVAYHSSGRPAEIKCHYRGMPALRCWDMLLRLLTAQTVGWAKSFLCLVSIFRAREQYVGGSPLTRHPAMRVVEVSNSTSSFLFFFCDHVTVAFKALTFWSADEPSVSVKSFFPTSCPLKVFGLLLPFLTFGVLRLFCESSFDPNDCNFLTGLFVCDQECIYKCVGTKKQSNLGLVSLELCQIYQYSRSSQMLLPAISLTLVTPVVARITRCSFPRRAAHLGCTGSTLLSYYLWELALWDATQARIPIEFCRGPAASFNARTRTGLPTCRRRESMGWHLLVQSSWDLDDPGNVVSLVTHLAAGKPTFWVGEGSCLTNPGLFALTQRFK